MKIADTRLKKIVIIVICSIILTVVLVISLLSPIAKHLIEKYSVKYSGRQITMDWIYINPFTGYVHISNLKIYESKKLPSFKEGDSIFFSAKGVSANFAMLKLLSKTIEIRFEARSVKNRAINPRNGIKRPILIFLKDSLEIL